jgi:hypothetical protein
MSDKLLPDFKCPMCKAEFMLAPTHVLVCEPCNVRSCSFECIKRHRADKHPHYRGNYRNEDFKLW